MKRWTEDEEEFVIACCEMGWLHIDIGKELDRSRISVKQKAMRLKISNENFSLRKTNGAYILELREKCPSIISLEEYKGNNTKILHKCLKCNMEYKSVPRDKLRQCSCRFCGYSNNGGDIPLNKQGITYLVYIPKYDLYKFGITSKTVKERMSDNSIYTYELILEHMFSKGIDAIKLEKQWKENLKEFLINTGLLNTGNTETFRI